MAYEPAKSSTKPNAPGGKSSSKLQALGDKKSQPRSSSEAALQECEELEAELAALKVAYEHYFLGVDRLPPARQHEDFKKRMMRLKNGFVRNTAAKFRVASLHNKFLTYERLWERTLQEIENGTYRRDLAKVKRRSQKPADDKARSTKGPVELKDEDVPTDFDVDETDEPSAPPPPAKVTPPAQAVAKGMPPPPPPESVAPSSSAGSVHFRGASAGTPASVPAVPAVSSVVPPGGTPGRGVPAVAAPARPAPKPGTPAAGTGSRPAVPAAGPRPAAASSPGELSDTKLKAVYDAYVAAKRRNKEDTSKMSYESVAASLRKQVPELMKQHNAKAVEFKVVIKDGKAMLKAVPK